MNLTDSDPQRLATEDTRRHIFKYTLDKHLLGMEQLLRLPNDAYILAVQAQNESLTIWAAVIQTNPIVERTFIVVSTGSTVPADSRYLATAQFAFGTYVVHVYEKVHNAKG